MSNETDKSYHDIDYLYNYFERAMIECINQSSDKEKRILKLSLSILRIFDEYKRTH